jgi:hypothetical protein
VGSEMCIRDRYYPLQPLVVKETVDDNGKKIYRVVDGQQRLTTIYLILQAINELVGDTDKDIYQIEYARKGSKEFLENIKDKTEEDAKENIDFKYMHDAYQNIKQWFSEKNYTKPLLRSFKELILRDTRTIEINRDAKNIRFIWYEIENEDEFDVFIRLNIGKIPLTNAELIKSYLIQQEKEYRRELSNEWDNIEYELADNEFFGFLTTEKFNTRIELLFQILLGMDKYKNYELYERFVDKYDQAIKEGNITAKDLWKQLKNIFYTLKYWYEDRELYHLIGYLISSDKTIVEIFKAYKESSNKKDFKNKLKNLIKETLIGSLDREDGNTIEDFINEIDEMNYSRDRKKLEKVFLLFNILTLINSSKDSYIKFSFYKYHDQRWSIEHITPQTDKKMHYEVIRNDLSKIKDKLHNPVLNNILVMPDEEFKEKGLKKLETIFSDEKIAADKDNIRNLTLLSFGSNSSLKNNFFPVKRNLIIEMDKNGAFIPIVTKNLFLKYYTDIDGNPEKWTYDDGENYLKALKKTLSDYLLSDTKKV